MMKFENLTQARKDSGVSYLGGINTSSKLKKNGKVSHQHTYGLYLAPHTLSGHNSCSHSTKECRLGCLHTSGRVSMEINSKNDNNRIQNARIIKTKLLFEQQDFFMGWLVADIASKKRSAEKKGYGFSVRLNCTSDIDWANVRYKGQNIFEIFSDVQFYDYTKNVGKYDNIAPNYHLTYSYTGRNWMQCKNVMSLGHNIAMIFNVKKDTDIPLTHKGYKVVNGDETDYRVNDGSGVIIGLKWKRIANKVNEQKVLNSVFVVNPSEVYPTYSNKPLAMAY